MTLVNPREDIRLDIQFREGYAGEVLSDLTVTDLTQTTRSRILQQCIDETR